MNEFKAMRELEKVVPKVRKILGRLINFNNHFRNKPEIYRAVASSGTMDLTGGTGNSKVRGSVMKFKLPKRRDIEKYAKVTFESDILDSMEMLLAHLESSESKAMLKRADAIRPLYEAALEEFDAAVDNLQELANAKAPAEVVSFFKKGTTAVSKLFETAVRDLPTLSQIDLEKNSVYFARFVDLDGLIEGDPYFVVWISKITVEDNFARQENGIAVIKNVTALRNIATAEVKDVTPKALEIAISKELSLHKISIITSRVPLTTLNSEKINRLLGADADAIVEDYEIQVETNDGKAVYLKLQKVPEIVELVKKHRAKLRMSEEDGGYVYYIER